MTRGASTIPARASSAVSPEPDMGRVVEWARAELWDPE